MPKLRLALLAICLLATLAPACSRLDPKPKDFTLASERPAKPEATVSALEAAELACKEETRRKGIASVVNIFSRLRRGSADEDYLACMKARGFEVKP